MRSVPVLVLSLALALALPVPGTALAQEVVTKTYDDGSVAAQGIFGQGIFIDRKRKLVIASNADWTRATLGPEPEAREAFYKQVQALIDAGK